MLYNWICAKVKTLHIYVNLSTSFFGYYNVPMGFYCCFVCFWGVDVSWIFNWVSTCHQSDSVCFCFMQPTGCTFLLIELVSGIAIWIILYWYLHSNKTLKNLSQFVAHPFLPHFFILLPIICILVPSWLSCRWRCLRCGGVLPFLSPVYFQ